jgi:hypothetical protein
MHLDTIQSFIYPTDTQLDFSKDIKIYMNICLPEDGNSSLKYKGGPMYMDDL